jgi:hypothetical protein
MSEVQRHGFTWEKQLIQNVYGASADELLKIKYNSKMDLPMSLNRKNPVDLSIKTTCSANGVCMADCLRVYDAVSSDKPFHMTVIYYKQNDETLTKKIVNIVEVNLTGATDILFGSLTREQIFALDRLVKSVPQKRAPTSDEHFTMYAVRNSLAEKSGAIHLDIKCNSQQSRLQCSFNHFQDFLAKNPDRIIAQSTTGSFRGGVIDDEIESTRRVFKKKSVPL